MQNFVKLYAHLARGAIRLRMAAEQCVELSSGGIIIQPLLGL